MALALILLIAVLAIWYATPYFLTKYVNKRGAQLPDYVCQVYTVHINPIPCSIDLYNVQLSKKSGEVPVPFFAGPNVHISLQWTRLIRGNLRSNITLMRPQVNFVQGPTAATTQTVLEPEWVTTVKQMVPLKINRFQIIQGDLHFYDFHAEPKIDMEMTAFELMADNLSNATKSKDLMPTTVVVSGHPFVVGKLDCHLAVNTDLKQPTFSEQLKLEGVPAVKLNSFLAKYGNVYAKSGDLNFYTELVSEKGSYKGYFKPFFRDLSFEPVPKDRGGLAALWATLANGLKSLVEDDNQIIATQVPVTGTYKDPNVDIWSAAFGLLKNAYLQSLSQGLNSPELAPGGKPAEEPKLDKPAPPRA